MSPVSGCGLHDFVDSTFAQHIDGTTAIQPMVATQHEADAHPGIVDVKCVQNLADARQQTVGPNLKCREQICAADLKPEDLVAVTLLAEPLGRNAEMRGELLGA